MCQTSSRTVASCLLLSAASALVLLSVLLGVPKLARACTCSAGPLANVSWPEDKATDAAIDTPIVVAIIDYEGNSADSQVHLADASGAEIELDQVQRIPPAWNGCGAAELAFVRPARALEPAKTYTVSVTFSGDAKARPISTFTVSDHMFVPDAEPTADITYLKAYMTPSCVKAGCNAFGEVRVALAKSPENLLWLVIRSSAEKHGTNAWPFRPEADRTVQRSVLLPEHDDCVDILIYGREGRALLEERRCAPDRCATSDVTGASTCGDPGFSTIDAAAVPAESCKGASVPLFSRGRIVDATAKNTIIASDEASAASLPNEQSAADEAAPQPGEKHAAAKSAASGCSALPRTSSSVEGLALVIACWALIARRRRVRCS